MASESSDGGLPKHIRNEELKQEPNDINNLTEERLDKVLDTFLKDFKAGELDARVADGYLRVQDAQGGLERVLEDASEKAPRAARQLRVHPGYVNTDMTMHSGILTPEEGASNATKVALLPEGGPTGAYFALDKEAPFCDTRTTRAWAHGGSPLAPPFAIHQRLFVIDVQQN
ncbi:(-)-isopiperitenone reductase-like [Setaria viridis]|uniref:(-)-isopiperitenone reductase-like n=1 Tax=Setaria viridis TaxID=4556 RepID=UPI003B3B3B8A